MKILMITPYVTITSRPEFSRNKTGFGYMVYDIAKAVAKKEQVEVLCTDSRGEGFVQENITFLARTVWMILSHLFYCLPISTLFRLKQKYRMSGGVFLRLFYYWLMSGYVYSIIKNRKYDVVHIHGCSFSGVLWDAVCKKCGVKIVYTLHGLNSFSDTVMMEPAGKQYERDFLRQTAEGLHHISVISTGMKKMIEKTYHEKCENIVVITNSFSFHSEVKNKPINLRTTYNIPKGAKVVLYVGNVSINKNQRALVSAFPLMEDELCEKTYVLFLGRYAANDALIEQIDQSPYKDHLILCGPIDKEVVTEYYKQADATVLLSVSEGFGLSLIEGMHFGLPCIMPKDLDAFEDIYDECAVIPVKDRSEIIIVEALGLLLSSEWEKEKIKTYSEKFESEKMAEKYCALYNKVLYEKDNIQTD